MAHAYPVVLDWIDRLEEFKSADEAWRSFLSFVRRYGFSYGGIADLPNARRQGLSNVLALTWPESWRACYAAGKYLRRDPSVRALAHTREPFTWTEGLAFDRYSRAERNIVFEARNHGLNSGFVVPISGIRSGAAVVTIAGEDTDQSPRARAELHFAAIYAQARIRALLTDQPNRAEMPRLSPRECECLEWAAMGKTDWEIGEILTIAARTAGSHIERAKEKLGVATRIQAVVIALQSGIISV
ncbi:MAG TPA: LuxR family transcriptional regulator [Rhizomicrobium sp.]